MLRDLEAFLRYVTLIAVRFYLLTYNKFSIYRVNIVCHDNFDLSLEFLYISAINYVIERTLFKFTLL